MTDLRKAAEAVLEAWAWDWSEPRNEALKERMEALRQALAQPEWVGLTDEERFKIARDTRPYVADTMRAHEEELKRRNT